MFKTGGKSASVIAIASFVLALLVSTGTALAATPVVKTVPWVSTNPLIAHDTWIGKVITFKGTTDVSGGNIEFWWDFGDGNSTSPAVVTDNYNLGATHAYSTGLGTTQTATLWVHNTTTDEKGSQKYYVTIRSKTLDVEVNVAIDEGLWFLHTHQTRWTAGTPSIDYGDWSSLSSTQGLAGACVNAFEVNGHTESLTGDNDPYKETVARGLKTVFTYLYSYDISGDTNHANSYGAIPEDYDGDGIWNDGGNDLAITNSDTNYYQHGMLMDAIIASGTPGAIAQTGGTGVVGRSYQAIIQDMVDALSNGQYGNPTYGGGWYYSWGAWGDNSISQWSAIGIIAATKNGWAKLPPYVIKLNPNWLYYSQDSTNGNFGYQSMYPIWGPYAVTNSGLVQMVMDGIGRGDLGSPAFGMPSWDKAERFMYQNFGNPPSLGAGGSVKAYYYGMFSFVKAMRLTKPAIKFLRDYTGSPMPQIDWYGAEVSKGDWTDGVARTLVTAQNGDGSWEGHYYTYGQDPFETAWAVMMLGQTLFEAGSPVAVATATPNPGIGFQPINFDGSGSYQQDSTKSIVKWEWDFNGDGITDATGPSATYFWPAVGSYPVTLTVTDNSSPAKTATATITVLINTPPIPPTANAGGPYNFCPNVIPWYLDGTKSVNPDDGKHQTGPYPGDFIKSYLWDLNGDGVFGDVAGAQPNATAFLSALGLGAHLISLKVTDNTAASFPASGLGDLSSIASAQVFLLAVTDPSCACVSSLTALAKNKQVQLSWTKSAGADHYNVYRSLTSGGPYTFIGTAPQNLYLDYTVSNGTTYYYVVRPAALNGNENCQSNQASATPKVTR
ncbi:MAG: PKD domain-containing protein [Acidobacteriota bacterium]|jgi:hypothetical protein